MGKIKEILIDQFNGGMATDPREKDYRKFYHTKNFDVFSFPHKLSPRPTSAIQDATTMSGNEPLRFVYAPDSSGSYKLWVLIRQTSSGKAALLKWDSDNSQWDTPDGNLSDTTSVKDDVFAYYDDGTTKFLYFFDGSRYLQRYNNGAETGGVIEQYHDFTSFTYVSQPVHFLKDDNLYFFVDNKVYKKDGTAAPALALTLPSNGYIAAGAEYGDYIAIAFNYTNEIRSTVFLWNRNDSDPTVSQRWELPSSKIYQLAVLNGRLIAIDTDFIKVYVRRYNGAEFEKINELIGVRKSSLEDQMTKFNTIGDDRLYFPMDYDAPGYADSYNTRLGIWVVDSMGRITLDYAISAATVYKGLIYLSGDFWISYDTSSVTLTSAVAKTGITYSSTNPSVYETLFIGDANINKKLIKVGVRTESMPAAGQVVLKYRTTETSDWTTIFTNTTDNSYYHEAINIETTGIDLPEFRELQLRAELTGGAVMTGLAVKYEEFDDNLA